MATRVELPVATGSAADFIPPRPTLRTLREAAKVCRGCKLWMVGTQTVFGEGPATARVLIVGEQPGDQEDKEGHPFVGPAGRLLDAALEEAGIDRGSVYVTNAVKHFKWERGDKSKRRIHKKPNDGEIRACRPWLDHELKLVKPEVVVCLGATAAQALLGKTFRVTKSRGQKKSAPFADAVFATVHPSSILRARDAKSRDEARRAFVTDLRKVARFLGAADREVRRSPKRAD
jgi:uracil-DNA glycosylase family protein